MSVAHEAGSNPLADQLATLDVHPDDRKVLNRIAARFSHVTEGGCIVLHGQCGSDGRPQIGADYMKIRVARLIVAWRDGLNMRHEWDTRHTCNVRACVNPDHLLSGTRQENSLDRYEQGTAPIGERAPHAKLTADQVWQVLDLVHAGQPTLTEIAQRFGCSLTTVSKIKNGLTWRHVWEAWHESVQPCRDGNEGHCANADGGSLHTPPRGRFAGIGCGMPCGPPCATHERRANGTQEGHADGC